LSDGARLVAARPLGFAGQENAASCKVRSVAPARRCVCLSSVVLPGYGRLLLSAAACHYL